MCRVTTSKVLAHEKQTFWSDGDQNIEKLFTQPFVRALQCWLRKYYSIKICELEPSEVLSHWFADGRHISKCGSKAFVSILSVSRPLSHTNTNNKIPQLVSQHCCETGWKAMLRVFPSAYKLISHQNNLTQRVSTNLIS